MAFKLDFNLLNVYLVTTLEDNLESFMDFDGFFCYTVQQPGSYCDG